MTRLSLYAFFVFILLLFAVFIKSVFAQFATQSNTVRTKVGNPPQESNNLVKAALDTKDAYHECAGGYTFDARIVPPDCLKTSLGRKAYANSIVDAFEARRKRSLVNTTGRGFCSECVGFVAISLTLISADTNTLSIGSPHALLNVDRFSVSGPAGSYIYRKIGSGDVQPGDIGIGEPGYGHILIVKEPKGHGAFIGIESHWGLDCSVKDSIEHSRFYYTFFRREDIL